jgi:hypothetical protein
MGTRIVGSRRSPHSIADRFLQWVKVRDEIKFMEDRQKQLRNQMMSAIETEGEKDEKGSLFLELTEPIEYDGKTYGLLKKERRVGSRFLEDDAEKLLESKGLLAEAQKTVVVLDQDSIYRLHQEGKLTEAEIDSMFQESVTWAFKPMAG